MTRLWAGIDGGQSSSIAVVGDERGAVLGRGVGGPADEVGEGVRSTRLRDALETALHDALRSAGFAPGVRLEGIVAGVSGYDGRLRGRAPRFRARVSRLLHDAPIAHAGAFALEPGVLVIAGTGSVVYAGTPEAGDCAGGWGYLFGDEGSGFWLAREALAQMMRAQDEGAGFERERAEVLAFFGYGSLRELAAAFYAGLLTRHRLAAFAPALFETSAFGGLVARGAARLAEVAAASVRRSGLSRVALSGGLFRDLRYRESVAAAVLASAAHARVVAPRYDPPRGALLLAYRAAGWIVGEVRG